MLLQYKGVYCLVVELLTSDEGIGLAAHKEMEKKEEGEEEEDPLRRITS